MARAVVVTHGDETAKATADAMELLHGAELRITKDLCVLQENLNEADTRQVQIYYLRAWTCRRKRTLWKQIRQSPAKKFEPEKMERKELYPNKRHIAALKMTAARRKK